MKITDHTPEPVAIIGMACIFPKARDLKSYWRNILAAIDAIDDPLPEWEALRYLSSGRIHTYRGGFLNDLYRFDPLSFGIMPSTLDGGEPDQFLALRVAHEALIDAGYGPDHDYDHVDTGIILGHSAYLHRGQACRIQHDIVLDQTIELLQALFPHMNADQAAAVRGLLQRKLPPSSADNATGLVPNVMTGRIANRLNLRGPNFIIDAACSSSLLAVNAAIDELRVGRSRLMLAGGINAALPAEAAVIFTQVNALSKSGRIRPFDAECDGTVLGEGVGMVVLKRAADAMADGDRIYALVRAVGVSSDGKALGLLAPSQAGEALAMERAYTGSGIDPATVELIEAHGTGISLGDKTEINALRSIFGERTAALGHIALGSVKSMIGHCIPAAGIAGLIKTALALHHRIQPPMLCGSVNPDLGIETTPFFVNTTPRPWFGCGDAPRRAAVNAFGFGGINTHAVLEQAPDQALRPPAFSVWPYELFVFSASDAQGLRDRLEKAASLVTAQPEAAAADLAAHLIAGDAQDPLRLAIVAQDTQDLLKKITTSIAQLQKNARDRWATRNGIVFSGLPLEGKVAFLFPGEGSQYPDMLTELAMCFPEARRWFDFWRGLYGERPGESRTDIAYPPPGVPQPHRETLEARLHDMDVGSEAVFIGSQAVLAILKALGVHPDVMLGHSTGESSALAATGAIAWDSLPRLREIIKDLNQTYRRVLEDGQIPTGALLSVGALPQSEVETRIAAYHGDVVIAMDNCANQLILYGPRRAIGDLQQALTAMGGICMPLPFDRGYHTPFFSAVSGAFLGFYERIGLTRPRLPLYSCASVDLFPEDEPAIRNLAARQWSVKVRFRETIARMYRDGVRYFVEVGPSGNLTAFVNDILGSQEHVALATNLRRKNAVQQFLTVLAHLYANGRAVALERLFAHRAVSPLSATPAGPGKDKAMRIANTMPIMHLDPEDQAALKEVLRLPEKPVESPRDTAAPAEPAPSGDRPEAAPQNAETSAVMAGYFDLMHQFLDQQRRIMECRRPEPELLPLDQNDLPAGSLPFLQTITHWDENRLEASCRLSVHEDNFLRHHILSGPVSEYDADLPGLCCVPLMVSLEIMAEACTLLNGGREIRVIENVKASAWIALDREEVTLEVHAAKLSTDGSRTTARLINHSAGGVIALSADFDCEADWRAEPLPALAEKRAFCWEDQELYARGMFHGPVFQSIRRIEGWNEHGIDAALSEVELTDFFIPDEAPALVLNPILLDALGQLAAYWIIQQIGTDFNCFPSAIERIELYAPCPQQLPGLTCRGRQRPLDPNATDMAAPRLWQFECLTPDGRPLLRAINLVNIFFPVPHQFYQVRMDPLSGRLGEPMPTPDGSGAMLWRLSHLTEAFCTQSGGIFLDILAHALLDAQERQDWRQLKGSPAHRRQWLFGRACIKEAVRFWVYQQTGRLLYPTDIVVCHNDLGAPYVDGWWRDTVAPAPNVSLSHDKRLSLAAVTSPDLPVGIDVEHIERIEQAKFFETAMTQVAMGAREREMLHSFTSNDRKQRLLRLWCAKEAAAKYLGIGLNGTPQEFNVSFLDDDWAQAHVTHRHETVAVTVACRDDAIMALARARAQ